MSEHKHFFKKKGLAVMPDGTHGKRIRVRRCRCGKVMVNTRMKKKEKV